MKPSGWRYESSRHSLAAKGIATKYQKKFPQFVKPFPGENPRVTEDYARFRQEDPSKFKKNSFRTIDPGKKGDIELVVARPKDFNKTKVQSVLVERKNYFAADTSPTIGTEEPSERLEEEERESKMSGTEHYCDVHKIHYTGDRCPEEVGSLKNFERKQEEIHPKLRVIW